MSAKEVLNLNPKKIIISPGPCTPNEAGISIDLIKLSSAPLLGVCLGHQAIADVNGMQVVQHSSPMHGKTSMIHHDGKGLFKGLPNPFEATRYHSLVVRRHDIPEDMEVSAWTEEEDIMALRWKPGWPDGDQAALVGVQFHPESFLTEQGPTLLGNFLASSVQGGIPS